MHICFDGQGLAGNLTGAGKAFACLLRQLRRDFPQHEYTVVSPGTRTGWRLPRQLFWEQVQFPWLALRLKGDLLHTPGGTSAPLLRHRRLVMTVHDIAPTRHPEFLPSLRSRWYWGRWIPFTAKSATALIVPSHSTKQDLMELCGVPTGRIHVVPLGVPLGQSSKETTAAVRARYNLEDSYLLYVGTIDRRKDYVSLLQALSQLDQRIQLVLAGTVIAGRTDFPQRLEGLGLTERVRVLGYVPERDLPGLYQGAAIFVYPSFYEGFGLPVLEAMAYGTPVITYHNSSLPEVAGDAGILLAPPWTADKLADAIRQLLEDHELRRELKQRGGKQVKRFDWQETARLTMQVYKALSGTD